MVEVANAIVISNEVFWLVAGGIVSLAVTVIMFEVNRLFKLVAAVRDVKEEIKEIRLKMEQIVEFERVHKDDHEAIMKELVENRHDHDRLGDRLQRLEK